jgi:hypothetical protein
VCVSRCVGIGPPLRWAVRKENKHIDAIKSSKQLTSGKLCIWSRPLKDSRNGGRLEAHTRSGPGPT